MKTAKKTGALGENYAEKYLKRRGWRILARNYISNGGEIDIVGYRFGRLVYFEVKTRSNDRFGTPAGAIDRTKIVKIKNAARGLNSEHRVGRKIPVFYPLGIKLERTVFIERIDGIEVFIDRDGNLKDINHIKDMENRL